MDAWNPAQYHRFQKERSQPGRDLIELIQGEGFAHAIDLGCGTGELTQELQERKRIGEIVGQDNSPAMLDQARTLTSPGLRFESGDIAKFAARETYDVIYSNAALQWVENHERIFQNCFQALKPQGQLAVQVPMNHDYPTHVIAGELAREEPYRSALGQTKDETKSSILLTPEAYASLLYRLGFREQLVRLQVYGHVLASRDEVIEWVKGTMLTAYQKRLPAELFGRFMADFRSRLFATLPDERPFFYPFKRLLLWARK